MAKASSKRVVGIRASSLAMYEGVFASLLGLAAALLFGLRSTVEIADQTESVLAGMVFGLSAGVVAIIVVPMIYFGIGYIIGYAHGILFNFVAGSSGGLVIDLEDE